MQSSHVSQRSKKRGAKELCAKLCFASEELSGFGGKDSVKDSPAGHIGAQPPQGGGTWRGEKPSGFSEGELAEGQEKPAWAVHVQSSHVSQRSKKRGAKELCTKLRFASGETEIVGEALGPPARTGSLFVQRRRGGTPGPPAFPNLHTHSWKSCRGDPYGRPPRLPPARGKLSAGRLTDAGAHLGFIPFR